MNFDFTKYLADLYLFLRITENNQNNLGKLMQNRKFVLSFNPALKILLDIFNKENFGSLPMLGNQFVFINQDWMVANYYRNFRLNGSNGLDAYTLETIIASIDYLSVFFLADNVLPAEYSFAQGKPKNIKSFTHEYEINKFVLKNKVEHSTSGRIMALNNQDRKVIHGLLNENGHFVPQLVAEEVNSLDDILIKHLKK